MSQVIRWPSPLAVDDGPGTQALRRCGPLQRKGVLVVDPDGHGGWTMLRAAKAAGALVTVLCPGEMAELARSAGADVVMDAARQDPAWYGGAWTLIYDPAGRLGYGRVAHSLERRGTYLTAAACWADRARAVVARLGGGPRLVRLDG